MAYRTVTATVWSPKSWNSVTPANRQETVTCYVSEADPSQSHLSQNIKVNFAAGPVDMALSDFLGILVSITSVV